MQIGIVKESLNGENRVSASPASIQSLIKLGFDVIVEAAAGDKASFNDDAYQQAGAVISDRDSAWQADIVLKVNQPTMDEVDLLKDGANLISFIAPAQNDALLEALKQKNINTLAMEMVPRMTRSQSMDALSSMANIAGYRAVVEATHHFGRFLTGQITAAGKIPPAKVLIIGAGVAGLAAIGTAGSLGAIVRAFDTRPEVKEQIESMGAQFLELDFEEEAGSGDGYAKEMSQAFIDAEMALFREQAKDVDIIITTAMIPGKPAPKLILEDMVGLMKPGSVIVDLAAPGGGNCELTKAGEVTEVNQVKIIGYTDLVSRLPNQASQLYANNLVNLLKLLCKEKNGQIDIDFNDQVIRNMTVVKDGKVTFPPPPIKVSATPTQPKKVQVSDQQAPPEVKKSGALKYISMVLAALAFVWIASVAPSEFLSHFTVFVLACVVGYHLVWNVTHALHTPLMSVTNAISGIIIVGALLQVGSDNAVVQILAGVAVLIASINIAGGFLVTKRMLKMFRKEVNDND
ncbi:Re/Si-specific NAD(P)(+) transhydrogenase subunit alpha [Thalassotalea ponticola]|uniref:Re/Si-specific NAD(P)(+) transhydrogenase subunit alpha n=1 Tax=Thalassotalea ponticola TaxID=1523392 RepID=UPI0025B51962|nr:Re/Si-specific NAD(P)(+) transhydrogenase subunit alpha [Thalassotalea ponticola]MDN3653236.1 Re/Si-specific NAD(P)(+) transhydrogenase subunit alpha [Thalassotalea ponticola]